MRLGIMQPYFFPYIGYWQLINAVDKFVIYDDVNYIKQGWINRNSILINNERKFITLSLSKASSNTLINQINKIDNTNKILKTLELCYKKAPYYSKAMPIIEELLRNKEANLAKFIGNSIERISDFLMMNTEFVYSSTIKKQNDLKGQEKVIDICRTLKTDEYINSIGGQSLYLKDKFLKDGINLLFLKSLLIEYHQFNREFVPNLSIIDVIMFNPVEKIKIFLKSFILI
jgi:hypothetical protein